MTCTKLIPNGLTRTKRMTELDLALMAHHMKSAQELCRVNFPYAGKKGGFMASKMAGKSAQHLPEVTQITPEIMAMAGSANQAYASGGMVTKLEAARIATAAGCEMLICDGRHASPLSYLSASGRFTRFPASHSPQTARKKWISGALTPKGRVKVDAGAQTALRKGRSLLPAGILSVSGQFERGDLIEIENNDNIVIGHGLSSYASTDVATICGHKTGDIEALLGYRGRDEIIHADNLVLSDC